MARPAFDSDLLALVASLLAALTLPACSSGASPSSASTGATSGTGGTAGNGASVGTGGASTGGGATVTTGAGGASPSVCGNGIKEAGEACDDGNASGDDGCAPTCTESVAMTMQAYAPSDEDFPNPERGFFDQVNLAAGAPEAMDIGASGLRLAYAPGRLDAYRDKPLDDAILTKLGAGLAAVRAAGIKVSLRFVYNDGFDPDAPKAQVLQHIQQLGPLLAQNADVIAAVQAGFIGAWGEWHSSTNGLSTPETRKDVLLALLGVVPVSRAVQIRTPMFKDEIFPGGPLSEAEAGDGSPRARTGHHNDCFLASDDDVGTYADPVATWKSYVGDDGRFVPVGGETCGLDAPRTDCPSALAEMSKLHFSFLNSLYHPDVLSGWEAQGCMPEVRRRLGYRIALDSASWSAQAAPGGALGLTVTLHNEGFAAPFNPRTLVVVLGAGKERRAAPLMAITAARWEPGLPLTVKAWLRVPSELAPGTYRLALWLPDEAASLAGDASYAIRLANPEVWDAATGENVLTEGLVIDPAAPGSVVAGAGDFVEIQ